MEKVLLELIAKLQNSIAMFDKERQEAIKNEHELAEFYCDGGANMATVVYGWAMAKLIEGKSELKSKLN